MWFKVTPLFLTANEMLVFHHVLVGIRAGENASVLAELVFPSILATQSREEQF